MASPHAVPQGQAPGISPGEPLDRVHGVLEGALNRRRVKSDERGGGLPFDKVDPVGGGSRYQIRRAAPVGEAVVNPEQNPHKGVDLVESLAVLVELPQGVAHETAEFRIFQVQGLQVVIDAHAAGQHRIKPGVRGLLENDRVVPGHETTGLVDGLRPVVG